MPFVPLSALDAPLELIERGSRALARSARRAVCGIRDATPDWLVDRTTPGGIIVNSWLDDFCYNPSVESPFVPPLQGGQCPTRYRPFIRLSFPRLGGGQPFIYSSQGALEVNGRIRGLKVEGNGANNLANWVVTLQHGLLNQPEAIAQTGLIQISRGSWGYPVTEEFRVVRSDGLADQCVQPIPPPNLTPPPLNILNPTYNFNIGGVIVPLTLVYVPIDVDLNVRVNPLFRFDLGGINIDVNFDGVDINFGDGRDDPFPFNFPNGDDPRTDPPPTYTPPNDRPATRDDIVDLTDKVNDIINTQTEMEEDIADLLDCERCEEQFTITTIEYGSEQSREQVIQPKGEYVKLTIDNAPLNRKTQNGIDAPDVIYAGWASFSIGSHQLPRQPAHYASSVFSTPPNATNFTYTLYEGFSARMMEAYRDEVQ
jgi:hypothetical protein